MSTGLTDVLDAATASGHVLVRTHPRPDRLHVEMHDARGQRVIGQWLPDDAVAREIARGTEEVAPGSVELHDHHLVIQHAGADRRLRVLPQLVADGGELVVHRPERRAVVRTTDGSGQPVFTKVVRPRRTADLVRRMETATRVPGLRVPRVVTADEGRGTVELTTLPGRTLHDLLAEPTGPATGVATAVGEAIQVLHEGVAAAGTSVPEHDLDAEVRATRALIDLARGHRVLSARVLADLERAVGRAAARIVATGRVVPVLLHRDLHDKQLLVDGGGVGVLDVDMLAVGDPALDLGNLLAHLDLRVAQGWTTEEVAAPFARELLESYAPDARTVAATAGYRALTAARLQALYAFRPGDRPSGPAATVSTTWSGESRAPRTGPTRA